MDQLHVTRHFAKEACLGFFFFPSLMNSQPFYADNSNLNTFVKKGERDIKNKKMEFVYSKQT